ncbi:hypothetical protein RZS08_21990, partial [Arthrospira platensis SPKY1]|nr:hypothetical protein [Arthrospira platensis SPKY1]
GRMRVFMLSLRYVVVIPRFAPHGAPTGNCDGSARGAPIARRSGVSREPGGRRSWHRGCQSERIIRALRRSHRWL